MLHHVSVVGLFHNIHNFLRESGQMFLLLETIYFVSKPGDTQHFPAKIRRLIVFFVFVVQYAAIVIHTV